MAPTWVAIGIICIVMFFILVSNIMRARRWRKTGQINFPKERYSGGGYEVANVTQEALDYKRGIISSTAVKEDEH